VYFVQTWHWTLNTKPFIKLTQEIEINLDFLCVHRNIYDAICSNLSLHRRTKTPVKPHDHLVPNKQCKWNPHVKHERFISLLYMSADISIIAVCLIAYSYVVTFTAHSAISNKQRYSPWRKSVPSDIGGPGSVTEPSMWTNWQKDWFYS
jgi:hypothetical protein